MKSLKGNEYYSRAQVSEKLQVHPSTLKNWERARKGPRVIRVSPRVALYPMVDLENYLRARMSGAAQ